MRVQNVIGMVAATLLSAHAVSAQQTIQERARAMPTSDVVQSVHGDVPTPSLEQLVAGAAVVVEASVISATSYLSDDQTYILTDYDLLPARVLSGQLMTYGTPKAGQKQRVVLTVRGGSWVVDGRTVRDVNFNRPSLKPGTQYLLFLAPSRTMPGKYNLYATGGFEIRGSRLGAPTVTQADDVYRQLQTRPYESVIATVEEAARTKKP